MFSELMNIPKIIIKR